MGCYFTETARQAILHRCCKHSQLAICLWVRFITAVIRLIATGSYLPQKTKRCEFGQQNISTVRKFLQVMKMRFFYHIARAKSKVLTCHWAPNQKYILSVSNDKAKVWSTSSWACISSSEGSVCILYCTINDERLVCLVLFLNQGQNLLQKTNCIKPMILPGNCLKYSLHLSIQMSPPIQ